MGTGYFHHTWVLVVLKIKTYFSFLIFLYISKRGHGEFYITVTTWWKTGLKGNPSWIREFSETLLLGMQRI
jgi:hypothetical protein